MLLKKTEPLGEFGLAMSYYSGRLWPKHIGMLVPVCPIQRLGCAQKSGSDLTALFRNRDLAVLCTGSSQVRESFGAIASCRTNTVCTRITKQTSPRKLNMLNRPALNKPSNQARMEAPEWAQFRLSNFRPLSKLQALGRISSNGM